MQIRGLSSAVGDQLIYELVTPTSDLARQHFYLASSAADGGQAYVGLSLTQTNTSRFSLYVRARDLSSRPKTSNRLKVGERMIMVNIKHNTLGYS